MSENLCYFDASARQTDTTVVATDPDAGAVLLDRTVFYSRGGGRAPDTGLLEAPTTCLRDRAVARRPGA